MPAALLRHHPAPGPLSLPGCLLYLDARYGAGAAGSSVAQWSDLSPSGWHATQATGSKQPTVSHINGVPALNFDGVDDNLVFSPSLASGSALTVYIVSSPASATGTGQRYFDIATGRLIVAHIGGNAANNLSYFDGTVWGDMGATVAGPQILSYVLDATAVVYRNGVRLGASTYAKLALGGASAIGAANNSLGTFYAGKYALLVVYQGAHTPAQRWALERRFARAWRIPIARGQV